MHLPRPRANIWNAALLALLVSACDQPARKVWSWSGDGPSRTGLLALEDGVLFGNEAGAVVRLTRDGAVVWRAQVGREVAARPAVVGDTVVTGTVGGEWVGLNLHNGQERWRLAGKPVLTLPLASDDKRAFAVADDGSVLALSGASGGTVWKRFPPRGVAGVEIRAAPVVLDGRLFVALGKAGLWALHPEDGEARWNRDLGDVLGFLVEGARVYAVTREGRFFALNAATGATEWERALGVDVSSGPSLARGLLWVAVGDRGLLALDPQDGAEAWRVQLPAPVRGKLGEYRELVLVPTDGREGRLLGFRPGQLQPVVNLRTDSALRTAPRVFGDSVLVQASDGRVLAYEIQRTTR